MMLDRVAGYDLAVMLAGVLAFCVGQAGAREPATATATATITTAGAQEARPSPSPSCSTSSCHADVMRHARLHGPVAANRCDVCHEAIDGGTPFLAGEKHTFKRVTDSAESCYACHDRLDSEAHVHEPVRLGVCVLCHDPHGSDQRALLRVGSERQLCTQCHRETVEKGDHIHGPVRVGACGACHDPHQSPKRYRLRGLANPRCGVCHLTDIEGVVSRNLVHKPVAEKCSNCHDPHSSMNPFRLVNTPPRLCLDCHENIDSQVVHGEVVHKPVKEGKCGNCHEHHASDFRRLLRGDFTPEPYEPFALEHFALCYRCHTSKQVTEAVTTTVTNFRNGDVNLHFKHINKEEKGRTCRMCHQVHASGNPRLLKDTTPFGTWQLPLNFQKTATGGSCMPGCHRKRGYDRITPVQNE